MTQPQAGRPTGYPKTLHHPGFVPAVCNQRTMTRKLLEQGIAETDSMSAKPARFPPVTVNNEDQEQLYRAQGYRAAGERDEQVPHSEYPLFMKHPDHVAAVAYQPANVRPDGVVLIAEVKAVTGRFPDKLVSSPEEEEYFAAAGYLRPGRSDPDAVQASIASPYVPGRVVEPYPRMEGGLLVKDPALSTGGVQRYPMYLGGIVVENEAEELMQLRRMHASETPAPVPAGPVDEPDKQVLPPTKPTASKTAPVKNTSRSEMMKEKWAERRAAKAAEGAGDAGA